jgi:hypothetical protein
VITTRYYYAGIGANQHLRARMTCELCGWSLSEALSPQPSERELGVGPNTYVPHYEESHPLALIRLAGIHTLRHHAESITAETAT